MRMSYYLNRDHYGDYMTDIARMPPNKSLDFSDNAEWDNDIEGNGCNRENEAGDKRRRAIFFRSSENKHSADETFERDAFWKIPNYVDETISSIGAFFYLLIFINLMLLCINLTFQLVNICLFFLSRRIVFSAYHQYPTG